MSNTSVVETIAERIEQELGRVRAARPSLSSRIDRAGNILVTHLSCRRQRLIRVRVRDGRARFLVSGSKGAVYVVDPGDWSCTCPDHHRHGRGCKHALACWALWRAGSTRVRPATARGGAVRRCEAEPKVTRHDSANDRRGGFEHVGEVAGRVLAEASEATGHTTPAGSYEERECSRCLDGLTYDGQASTWVACGACSGSGRACVFVYPRAKTGTCIGCGGRFRHRDLFDVVDSLTFFEGDVLCGGCALEHGVL